MILARLYLFLLIIPALFSFCGCIDGQVYNEGVIEGHIIDEYGIPNPYVLVSVGDYPIVSPDANGKFSLENSSNPYNVVFTRGSYAVYKYEGLTRSNLNFCTFDDASYSTNTFVDVAFPKSSQSSLVYIKFISKEHFTQDDYVFHNEDTIAQIDLTIANGRTQIEGQILFLEYDDFSNFSRFGIKNVILNTGHNNQPVIFNDSDVSFDPPEIWRYCNVQTAGNIFDSYSQSSLSFPGMNKNSTIDFNENIWSYFLIPDIPSLNYRVKITNYIIPGKLYISENSLCRKWVFAEPGENIIFTHEITLFLQSPHNGETNITLSSVFSIEDTEPGGIYVYSVYTDPHLDYYMRHYVTDRKTVSLSDFKTRGYQFTPNTTYYWSVRKYPGYGSIDDFASGKFMNDTTYSKIPASETFVFVTQ
jgi:hypothetical protein